MIKGEIWWADLPENFYGSVPGKRRPVLVIQNDAINRSNIKTINVSHLQVPGNIFLEKSISGLEKTSDIMSRIGCRQIATFIHHVTEPEN